MSIYGVKDPDKLYDILKNMDNYTDKQLYEIIQKDYHNIMKLATDYLSAKFRFICTSSRILSILNQVLSGLELTNDSLIRCNSFLFDSISKYNTDPYINNLLFIIGRTINTRLILSLEKLSFLDKDLCTFLAVSWKSSFKDFINVRRVNFTLSTSSYINLTPNQIIQVYYILSKNEIMNPIISTLLDTTVSSAVSKEESWVTDQVKNNDMAIFIAMIAILESLQPGPISRILRAYYEQLKYQQYKYDVKSVNEVIKDSPQQFIKLPIIIAELKEHGIYIP